MRAAIVSSLFLGLAMSFAGMALVRSVIADDEEDQVRHCCCPHCEGCDPRTCDCQECDCCNE